MSIKFCFIVILVACFYQRLSAQVGIGTTEPNGSSALEIKHFSKGVLIPRLTMSQRLSIASPAQGLMVYQIDSTVGFWHFTGNAWDVVGQKTEIRYKSYNATVNGIINQVLDSIYLLPGHYVELDYFISVFQSSFGSRTASFEVTNTAGDSYVCTSLQQVSETNDTDIPSTASGSFILKNMSNEIKKYNIVIRSSNFSPSIQHTGEFRFIMRLF